MSRLTLLLLATLLCGAVPCQGGRYAVLVGCNKGGSSVLPLKFAEDDARQFTDILTALGGFSQGNVRTVAACDSLRLSKSLASVDSLMRCDKDPNRLFLFYYSGHADAQALFLGHERFGLNKLRGYFDSCSATIKIGVFDACYSGAVTTLKGGRQTQPFYFQEQKTVEGQVIIASSAASEAAQESPTLRGSVFSHHWFNALRGSADVSGSRQVTVNQAYQYAYRKTLETTALVSGEIQHPVYKFDIHGQGDIVLTSLSKATSSLVLDGSCEGKFLVLGDDYIEVFADFSKKSGSESIVALGPGTYRIINALGRDIKTHSFSLKNNETYRLNAGGLVLASPSVSHIKGPAPENAAQPEKEGPPLSTHGWGPGVSGMLLSVTKEPSLFLTGLHYVNTWYATAAADLFLDLRCQFPGNNAAIVFGLITYFNRHGSTFFAGLGMGPQYIEKAGAGFKDRTGVAFMLQAGYSVEVSRRMELRFQVPYTLFAANKTASQIGIEAQWLFFGPYRDVKVLHP
jgi:hypothetical protein